MNVLNLFCREREIEERRKKRQQRHAQQGISKKPESTMKARDYEAEEMEYEKSKQVRGLWLIFIGSHLNCV